MKKVIRIILIVIMLLIIIPYLVPLSRASEEGAMRPFDNSFTYEDTIHYRIWKPESGKIQGKILMVHGLGGSTYSFGANAPFFAENGFLVIAVDLPGFGYSKRGNDINHAQRHRADQLWDLLESIDQALEDEVKYEDWHLAGHSMGGGTVGAMAAIAPKRTKSLLLIDGALTQQERKASWLIEIPPVGRALQVLLEHVFINERGIGNLLASAYGRPLKENEIKGYLDPLLVKGTARGLLNFVKTSENIPLFELSNYNGPVLALWGENDTWVPLNEIDRIRAYVPALEVVIISGAAHCPMETHPEVFNQDYYMFLLENDI